MVADRRLGQLSPQSVAPEGFRVLFERAAVPMWVYDLDTLRVLDVNDAALRRLGGSRDELLQRAAGELPAGAVTHDLAPAGRLAGPAAHELNNILCVILAYADTVLALLEPGEMRDDVAQIHRA